MSKLTELESQAVKEGVVTGPPSNAPDSTPEKVAEQADSTPASQSKETQVPTPVKSGEVSEDNVPFHKHPRFQDLLKRNKEWESKYSEIDSKLRAQEAYLKQLQALQSPLQQQLPDEQRQAIVQLAKLFKQVPEFQKELGLDKIEELQKQNESLSIARSEETFRKEFDETVDYAVSLGMDKDEITEQLLESVQSHPVYNQVNYRKGMVRAVFRDYFWDKMGKLKEREINSRLIKEQEIKRKSNAETSSPSSGVPQKAKELSMEQFLKRRIQEEGGIVA